MNNQYTKPFYPYLHLQYYNILTSKNKVNKQDLFLQKLTELPVFVQPIQFQDFDLNIKKLYKLAPYSKYFLFKINPQNLSTIKQIMFQQQIKEYSVKMRLLDIKIIRQKFNKQLRLQIQKETKDFNALMSQQMQKQAIRLINSSQKLLAYELRILLKMCNISVSICKMFLQKTDLNSKILRFINQKQFQNKIECYYAMEIYSVLYLPTVSPIPPSQEIIKCFIMIALQSDHQSIAFHALDFLTNLNAMYSRQTSLEYALKYRIISVVQTLFQRFDRDIQSFFFLQMGSILIQHLIQYVFLYQMVYATAQQRNLILMDSLKILPILTFRSYQIRNQQSVLRISSFGSIRNIINAYNDFIQYDWFQIENDVVCLKQKFDLAIITAKLIGQKVDLFEYLQSLQYLYPRSVNSFISFMLWEISLEQFCISILPKLNKDLGNNRIHLNNHQSCDSSTMLQKCCVILVKYFRILKVTNKEYGNVKNKLHDEFRKNCIPFMIYSHLQNQLNILSKMYSSKIHYDKTNTMRMLLITFVDVVIQCGFEGQVNSEIVNTLCKSIFMLKQKKPKEEEENTNVEKKVNQLFQYINPEVNVLLNLPEIKCMNPEGLEDIEI